MIVPVDGPALALERIELGAGTEDGRRREAFVQALVHDHPAIIPMTDIEPAFTPLVSVCLEMATSAGFLDNLWLTPAGGIVLGECKLVRNPQARREVVAQALDYARALKGWHFDDLEGAARKATKNGSLRLWDLVAGTSELAEAQFVDAVERRLRFGRFMLLIIGDGIQEGVEALTEHLQLHAGLHASIALVDLSLWRDPQGRMLVVPRVPMKTVLVERGIVVIDQDGARIDPPTAALRGGVATRAPRPVTASEPEFFLLLDQKAPGTAALLKPFVERVREIGIEPQYSRSLVFRWYPSADSAGSAGYVDSGGKVWLNDAWDTANKAGRPDAGETYLAEVAGLIGGRIRRYEKTAPTVMTAEGRSVDVKDLLRQADGWIGAILRLIGTLAKEA